MWRALEELKVESVRLKVRLVTPLALQPFNLQLGTDPGRPRISALLLALVLPALASAAPPAALAMALEQLRDQKSYSWEMINLDPAPMGAVLSPGTPNEKGTVDLNGDMLLVREWTDGLKLETFIGANGTTLTNTPEGWMTNQEILTALSDERIRAEGATPRMVWLRRADRPNVHRPDEEIVPLLKSNVKFEEVAPDSFVASGRIGAKDDDDPTAGYDVTITLNLRGGVVRDYEILIATSRRVTRAHVAVPVSEHRSIVLTYVPKARVPLPQEARDKLKSLKSGR